MHLNERLGMTIKEIGAEIKARRVLLGVTQADVAEISGISLRTIKAIELGKANPTVNILQCILETIGLTLSVSERISHE